MVSTLLDSKGGKLHAWMVMHTKVLSKGMDCVSCEISKGPSDIG